MVIEFEGRTYALRADEVEPRSVVRVRRHLTLALLSAPVVFGLFLAGGGTDWPFSLAGIGVFLVAAAVAYRPMVRLAVARAQSFRLSVSPSRVRRVMAGLPALEVERAQVAKAVEWPGLGLELCDASGRALLLVPEHLEDYAEVRKMLAAWARSIETRRESTLASRQAVGVLLSFTMIGSWLGTTAEDLRLAVLAAVSLFAHLGVFAWFVVRDPNVATGHKFLRLAVFAFLGAGGVAALAVRLLAEP